jgi:hypothetical protein
MKVKTLSKEGDTLMKRIPTLAAFALAASLAISFAVPNACAQGVELKVRIPFQFNVAETSMPAGTYFVSSPESGVIRIANADRNMAATVTTTHDFRDPQGVNQLVFNKYGDLYFLHTVICARASQMNVDLSTWKSEKRARAQEAKLDQFQQVMVAAN